MPCARTTTADVLLGSEHREVENGERDTLRSFTFYNLRWFMVASNELNEKDTNRTLP